MPCPLNLRQPGGGVDQGERVVGPDPVALDVAGEGVLRVQEALVAGDREVDGASGPASGVRHHTVRSPRQRHRAGVVDGEGADGRAAGVAAEEGVPGADQPAQRRLSVLGPGVIVSRVPSALTR